MSHKLYGNVNPHVQKKNLLKTIKIKIKRKRKRKNQHVLKNV